MSDCLHGPWIAAALTTALTSAKLKLWTSGTADPDAHYMGDVDGSELSTTGYTAGFAGTALTLSGVTATYNATTNKIELAGTAGTLTSIGVPAGVSITLARIYIPNTTYANSAVIATFACAKTLVGSDFTITLDAVGIGTIAV